MSPRLVSALAIVSLVALAAGLFWLRNQAPAPGAPPAAASSAPTAPAPSSPPSPAEAPPAAELPAPPPAPTATPGTTEPTAETELARIEAASVSGQASALPTLSPYLTHPDPSLRQAAREAMLQMGLAEAAPLLREAAGKLKDPREAILLLDAADFLSLPAVPLTGGARRPSPTPPSGQHKRDRPAKGESR